ncbi:MAG: septum site-determining protein MinC [Synergistaceae bacterium]|nr:septum site-determining protein MinC [Synergistaceae bacterium]
MAKDIPIVLKGVGYGIRLLISGEASDVRIIKNIRELPEQSFSLATGSGIVIDLQSRQSSGVLISRLFMELVWNRNLNILSWSSTNPETLEKLKAAGFPTGEYAAPERKHEEVPEEIPEEAPEEIPNSKNELYVLPTLLIHRSLRSGEKIEHDGDVTVFGHVNNGAEIIASGNISVFGKLKGLAHAGVNVKEGNVAYIFAYSFEPQQIRLGNLMNSKVGSQNAWWGKPAYIFMEENSLIIKGL